MRYEHIFCGWSKRLKPNEGRRAFIRSAGLRFAEMLTSALGQKADLTAPKSDFRFTPESR
jgi:hypothetical protein